MKQGFQEALFGRYGDRWALVYRPYVFPGRTTRYVTLYTYEGRAVLERVNVLPGKFTALLADLMAVERLLALVREAKAFAQQPYVGQIVDPGGRYVIDVEQGAATDGPGTASVTLADRYDLRESDPWLLQLNAHELPMFIADGRALLERILDFESLNGERAPVGGSLAALT